MSHRGGRHFYNPITQVPEAVQNAEDLSRIEVFQDPADPSLRRWCARRIGADGLVNSTPIEDSDHDRVIRLAQERWPGLGVYELQDPNEDSTWEGMGPSPRMWQVPGAMPAEIPPAVDAVKNTVADAFKNASPEEAREMMGEVGRLANHLAAPQPTEEQVPLRALVAPEPGMYVRLEDVLLLLETWAVAYDVDKNPSGAVALREAVDALKEIG